MKFDPAEALNRMPDLGDKTEGFEQGPENASQFFLDETKKFNLFIDSIIQKMPEHKFDLWSPEHWNFLCTYLEQITPEEYWSENWIKKNLLGNSLVHSRPEDFTIAIYNEGVFNDLVSQGVISQEHKEMFLAIMPEYGTPPNTPAWAVTKSDLTPEMQLQVYDYKQKSYDILSEKLGGLQAVEQSIRLCANRMVEVYRGLRNRDFSDGKISSDLLDALERLDHTLIGFGHFGNKYFPNLRDTNQFRPDNESPYYKAYKKLAEDK